jgi:hypothetical protein
LDNLELHQGGHRDTTTASSDDDQDQEGLDSNDVVLENTDGSELGPEFQMDTYDEEDEGGNAFNSTDMMMDDDHIDPNFTVPMDDLDSDEEEDNMIKPTDAILLAAHAEDDYSCLEVYVYDAKQGSLYVHHDIALPAFPLALAWTGHVPYSSIDGHQQSGGGSGSSSSSSGGGGSTSRCETFVVSATRGQLCRSSCGGDLGRFSRLFSSRRPPASVLLVLLAFLAFLVFLGRIGHVGPYGSERIFFQFGP